MSYSLIKRLRFGVSPILTRQLSAAMFVLSGHMMVAMSIALGLLQSSPERNLPTKANTLRVQLNTPASRALPPGLVNVTAPAVVAPHTFAPNFVSRPAAALAADSPAAASAASAATSAATSTATPVATLASASISVTPSNSAPNTVQASGKTAQPEATETPIDGIPYYYGLKQLSKKPEVIEDATTTLSLSLPGIETQTSILRLLINERGLIDSVELEQSNLSADLIEIITSAFTKLRFNPGEIDGVAVKCQLKIEVLLENADVVSLKR